MGSFNVPNFGYLQVGYGACMFPIKKGQRVTHNSNVAIVAFRAL
jgi:hypothetical protein